MTLRVLIIDDDSSFRKIVSLKLGSLFPDIDTTEYDSLSVAREKLSQKVEMDFDLVVLDQHLPDGKGTDLLAEEWFTDLAVLSVSSDEAPEIPGASIKAGATYFLSKKDVTQPLFEPLVRGIIDRNRLGKELKVAHVKQKVMEMAKVHIGTLRHEINNPLGAVLGAAYLIRTSDAATSDQQQAAELVEKSGKRIKHVLDKICEAMEFDTELEAVDKAKHTVFQIPGDEPWEK